MSDIAETAKLTWWERVREEYHPRHCFCSAGCHKPGCWRCAILYPRRPYRDGRGLPCIHR